MKNDNLERAELLKKVKSLEDRIEKRDSDIDWLIQYYESRLIEADKVAVHWKNKYDSLQSTLKEADKTAVHWRNKCDSVIRKCYKWLLLSKEWKEYRESYFWWNEKKCALCGSEKDITIHHPKYKKGLLPWEYATSEVVPLCKKCHYKVHKDKNHPLHEQYEAGTPLPSPIVVSPLVRFAKKSE